MSTAVAAPVTKLTPGLDELHHVAVVVKDVPAALRWYQERFACEVRYEDETWGLLRFANCHLALVTEGQHPPHCGFVVSEEELASHGTPKEHRDGTKSLYIPGPDGNSVELLADNAALRDL